MPRIPISSQRRRANQRRSPRNHKNYSTPSSSNMNPPHPATPFQTIPSEPGGAYLLCDPCSGTKSIPSLVAGNELARTSFILQCDSGGETSGHSSSKSNFLGPDCLRGNEVGNGNLQQPLVVVNSAPATSKLPIPTNPFLPLPHLGNAPFQPTQPTPIIPGNVVTPWNNVGTNPIFSAAIHNEVMETPKLFPIS
ncbi:hypothetical protein H5410_052832 [Solanum commersonii]|uniref:Uncharacterized protein n=1 Tax=Solanum commersonii TaxID=4109 RepID=A0A9J5X472_SOLCO|nr:hypothetical protein H5410_052832 [Solanum commersonii]